MPENTKKSLLEEHIKFFFFLKSKIVFKYGQLVYSIIGLQNNCSLIYTCGWIVNRGWYKNGNPQV